MSKTNSTAPSVGVRMGFTVTLKKLEKELPDGTRVRTHPRYRWRATFVESGKRKQRYFKTKVEADDWKREREEEALHHGTDAALSSSERGAVIEARDQLAEMGLSLREAITLGMGVHRKNSRSCSVAEMISRAVSSREKSNRSADYIAEMTRKLGCFCDSFGDRQAASITSSEVEEWLHGRKSLKAAGSVNSYRRILVVAFNDAKRRGYVDENPAEKTIQSKTEETEVEILEPSEADAMLRAADAEILPALTIGLFAGLRAAEIKRLRWEEVSLTHGTIIVRAKNAKSAKNRIVPMSDNLKLWLKQHCRGDGPVWPRGGRRLMQEARNKAGFGTPAEIEAGKRKGKKLKPWPKNALRHSYATYHLAEFKDAAELALHLGHETTGLIFAHYRKPVETSKAALYWSYIPASPENVVEMSAEIAA